MNTDLGNELFGESWFEILKEEVKKRYFNEIGVFLKEERIRKKRYILILLIIFVLLD